MASQVGQSTSFALAAAFVWAAALCLSQAQSPAAPAPLPPACSVAGTTAHVPSYLNDPFSQLKNYVPALKGAKFEDHPVPGISDTILDETGSTISAIMPRVPNLLAREELSEAALALPYMVNAVNDSSPAMTRGGRGMPINSSPTTSSRAADAKEIQSTIEKMLKDPRNRVALNYRIETSEDATWGPVFHETRTNPQNQPIGDKGSGSPRGTGFGGIWLMFEPSYRKQFAFRYIGHQKLEKRETIAIAFAQNPEKVITPAVISLGAGTCTYFTQGIVWIDPITHQIARLETDLLTPLTGIQVSRLHSETDFAAVQIPSRALTLWLPSRVEIEWQTGEQAGAERHQYSGYHLFGATARLVTDLD